jgi:hypothetical protein
VSRPCFAGDLIPSSFDADASHAIGAEIDPSSSRARTVEVATAVAKIVCNHRTYFLDRRTSAAYIATPDPGN